MQGCTLAVPIGSWRSRVTRKSLFFHKNHALGTLDFTGSVYWDPVNFSESTASLVIDTSLVS